MTHKTVTPVEREIATYSLLPIDRLIRREWGYFKETQDNWLKEGWDGNNEQFLFDEYPYAEQLVDLVGIDIPIMPEFKEDVIQMNDKYILHYTKSGAVEQFPVDKVRWGEVMPHYYKNPVENPNDWYNKIKPRLNPDTPERWLRFNSRLNYVKSLVEGGRKLYSAEAIGGYMYLRAMMGPEKTLFAFYDYPDMVHDMMKTWLKLVKTCLTKVQNETWFFRFLIGEDISYKNGLLISPDMIKEFIFPYYKDLIDTLRNGQNQFMHVEVDTDGNISQVVPLYSSVGFNVFRPFEVAAGNDVIQYAVEYPNIVISGGVDKRILASSKEAIKKEMERIIPFMLERSGYIPTCDHTVPSNVPFENYRYYRQLINTLGTKML
jgi:uroporphyrinogen-III decarboxylase